MYCNYQFRLIKLTKQDSIDDLPPQISQKMKISLFFKSYAIKAYSLSLLISLIAGVPTQANAGFFNDFVSSIIGQDTQAADVTSSEEFGTDDFSHNSQNMPLLESSIDPDMKHASNSSDVTIVDGGALLPETGLIGSGLESISSGGMTVYEVKEGDTLSEIAELYDVSMNTIKWENNLNGQSIRIGQKLNILPVTGVKHIVKKGDNLDKIAAKYEAETEDIMVFNDILRSTTLKQGDILYVPNGIIKPVVVTEKPSSNKKPTTSSDSSSTASSGYYMRPASGSTTSPYGPRKRGYHYGIDIGNSRGTTVSAAASGVVVNVLGSCVEGRTSCGGRYGNYITIEHPNGQRTRYAHLQKVSVSVGDNVSKGEKIGTIGNTGRSTGPHLHFEIEKSSGSKVRPIF